MGLGVGFTLVALFFFRYASSLTNRYVVTDSGISEFRGGRLRSQLLWHDVKRLTNLPRYGILRVAGDESKLLDVPYHIEHLRELAQEITYRTGRTIEEG